VLSADVDWSGTSALITNIKAAINRRCCCVVLKKDRRDNEVAHTLAQYALVTRSSNASFSFVPACIQDLCLKTGSAVSVQRFYLIKRGFVEKSISSILSTLLRSFLDSSAITIVYFSPWNTHVL
jgi:hypothetical protein